MYKIQFQTEILSEICEDPRGAHQFFLKSTDYKHNPWIIGKNEK